MLPYVSILYMTWRQAPYVSNWKQEMIFGMRIHTFPRARRDAEERHAEKRDAEKRDAKKRDAGKRDAKKRDAEKRDAKKRDAKKRDAEKRDAKKRDAEKRDAEKRDAEKEMRRKEMLLIAHQSPLATQYIQNTSESAFSVAVVLQWIRPCEIGLRLATKNLVLCSRTFRGSHPSLPAVNAHRRNSALNLFFIEAPRLVGAVSCFSRKTSLVSYPRHVVITMRSG
ncbi:hypothetical protein EV426DRAFT_371114 [Tirmania nivea]|nr:hypothetical protein EV426DRAFT_371114 [Tirmania nivea]